MNDEKIVSLSSMRKDNFGSVKQCFGPFSNDRLLFAISAAYARRIIDPIAYSVSIAWGTSDEGDGWIAFFETFEPYAQRRIFQQSDGYISGFFNQVPFRCSSIRDVFRRFNTIPMLMLTERIFEHHREDALKIIQYFEDCDFNCHIGSDFDDERAATCVDRDFLKLLKAQHVAATLEKQIELRKEQKFEFVINLHGAS